MRVLAVGDSIIDGVGTPAMQQALPAQFAEAVAADRGRRVDWHAEGLTGRDIDGAELLKAGERATNVQRLFNVREGLTREDDVFPARVMNLPAFGKYKDEQDCAIKDYDAMLDEYYEARGWDPQTGILTAEKLAELE